MKDNGATGMIIDVRGNMDGSVKDAVSMLDEIIPRASLHSAMDKNGNKDESTVDGEYYDLPLVVLVDRNSASAAEMFAELCRTGAVESGGFADLWKGRCAGGVRYAVLFRRRREAYERGLLYSGRKAD